MLWPDIQFGPINLWSMPKLGDTDLYSKIIFEHEDKNYQYRLTVSEFRDIQYLHVRRYYQSYEGDWVPTKEGASIPATIQNIFALLDGLIELCAKEESKDAIQEYFDNKLKTL